MMAVDEAEGVDPIAILGLAVRVPGAADLAQFWQNLLDGTESITFYSREEQYARGTTDAEFDDPSFVPAAPVVDQLEYFDADLFGMSAREATLADPQHRLFLETAHTALEDSGYDPARFAGPIGVYAGTGSTAYEWLNLRANSKLWAGASGHLGISTVNSPDYVATMVSYKLNLRGPSLTVHTACSTSMVALHLACEALRNGECDLALAGGVCVELPHGKGYVGIEGYTSPDGHCRPFDADAEGTLWGSGAGVVVLARLDDALAAGDHVRAVIRGNAINNDGAGKVGFSAPSVSGQAEAVAQAVSVSGVDPRTVGYIEAHGTGTALGDPVEVAALSEVYGHNISERQWCGIGSVKSNIGHLSQAAGVVGVAKAVLALENGIIPPTVNFERPNPAIDFPNSPFYVVTSPSKFESVGPASPQGPRRAAVSSFGIGGTNAHILLEEAPQPALEEPVPPRPAHLLQISAAGEPALRDAAHNLAAALENRADVDLADVGHTLRVGRAERSHRAVVVASDPAGAATALRDPRRLTVGRAADPEPRVAFMFSGQGAQSVGMGRELYACEPVFAAAVEECLAHVDGVLPALRDLLLDENAATDPAAAERLRETRYTQPALFVVEYALARLWESWGVRPTAMIGHSIGEYVAATLAGVFRVPDALHLVTERGRMMQSVAPGSMLAVTLDESDVVDRLPEGLVIATVNGPGTCVVAGQTPVVEEFAATLKAEGTAARVLRTSHAFHSPMMDPILAEFEAAVAAIPRSAPTVPFWSNVTGEPITTAQATDPSYWARHLRQAVRFGDCVADVLAQSGPQWCLVECGPGRQLTGLARLQTPRDGCAPQPSLPAEQDRLGELATILATAGRLWTLGVPVDVEPAPASRRRIPLPTYPFQRERYWSDPDPVDESAALPSVDPGPLAPADWYSTPVWRQLPNVRDREPMDSCVLVIGGPRGEALADALRSTGADVTVVRAGEPYDLSSGPTRLVHASALDGEPAGTDVDAVWRAQESGFFDALRFVQAAVTGRATESELRVDIVTSATEDVLPGDLTRPEHATLAGIARVAALDVSGLKACRIDAEASTDAAVIAAELLRPVADSIVEVALRCGRRWTLGYEQISLPDAEPELRDGGCYLITGGFGGIGITVAEDLARRAHVHLVLLSRSGLPPRAEWDDYVDRHGVLDRTGRAIAAIGRIEGLGSTVRVVAADVADPADLRRVRAELDADGRALAGIVHTAGLVGGGLLEVKERAAAESVLRPKVLGALALHQVFGDSALDFVVFCSSVTAIAGGLGDVDYCAANAFLDAYARSAHGWSARVVSVNWGSWADVGMAAEMNSPELLRVGYTTALGTGHPILQVRGEGFLSGRIAPDTHWVLDGHRMDGVPVVPGTAHLECAREAASRLLPNADSKDAVIDLQDVAFTAPFSVRDAANYEVAVVDGAFSVRQGTAVRATGTARWTVPDAVPSKEVEAIRARCTGSGAGASDRTTVLTFGPQWACLREVHRGTGEDLALIEAPEIARADLDKWVIHPAMLDVATSFGFSTWQGSYLPLGYGRVLIRERLPERFFSHIRYSDTNADNADVVAADVTLIAPDGRVLMEISDFTLRRIDPGTVAAGLVEPEVIEPAGAPALSTMRMEPVEAVRALYRLLATGHELGSQVVVTPEPIAVAFDRIRHFDVDAMAAGAGSARSADGAEAGTMSDTGAEPVFAEHFVAPRTETESQVASVWQAVLGIDRVGAEDDFFALGGNSLVAVQLIAEIRKVVRVKLPMRSLFEQPTVAALAARIDALRAESESGSEPAAGQSAIPRLRRR